MKKKLMAVLTASSVAAMAVGATLAAYAEPEQEQQIKDDDETYAYGVDSHCLYINTPDGFVKWKADERIKPNEIEAISFDNFYDENGEGIPAGAFENLKGIKTVNFKNTISMIGENAFKGCTSLVDIVFEHSPEVIDNKLITIGKSAFEGCTSIAELDFRETLVEKIGESAFKGCTSISKLVLYSEYTENSKTIIITSPVAEIGKSAFQDCTGLMDIAFDPDLREIGESAFEGCINLGKTEEKPNEATNNTDTIKWLHRVTFGNKGSAKLETIGKRAFYGCEKLTAFGFPDKTKTIGEYAFANCVSLNIADMWNCKQLTSIEKYAFFNCLSLTQVDFPFSKLYASGGYGYNSAFPKHTIAEGAFRNCSWLEGVILSPYVGYVAPGAFYKCKNLKYIGYYINENQNVGKNIEIKVDTEHSTQDPPNPPQNTKSAVDKMSASLLAASDEGGDSETVTIYVPPEVTVFSFNKAEIENQTAVRDETIVETFQKKLAEEHQLELTYDGEIVIDEPIWKYEREGKDGPVEPDVDGTSYISFYPNQHYVYYNGRNNLTYDEVMELYREERAQWEEERAQYEQEKATYDAWIDWLEENGVSELWSVIRSSTTARFKNSLYHVTLIKEPTSKDGEPISPIVLPEKLNHDVDMYDITKVDGSVDIVDIPVMGAVTKGSSELYYYDFSIMEAKGYEFTANVILGPRVDRTYRDESDISNPTASGLYGNNTGETLIKEYPVITTGPLDEDPNPTSSSSNPSSTTTSPGNPPQPVNPSNPPSLPPTPNTNDPIEPDPEPSEPESSDSEPSEPESSESESSEPDSSEPEPIVPPTQPNPNTGVCFLAPAVLVGATVVVVAARRRKMK